MNKKVWLAIGWGVFALAIGRLLDQSADGYGLAEAFLLWLGYPLIEEFVKWIGYKRVSSYSILIPVVFCVGEIALKLFDWNSNTPGQVGLEAVSDTLLISVGSLLILKHVAFWSLPYLLKFRWYAFPLSVLAHSIWNIYYSVGEFEPTSTALAPLMALMLIPFAVVLVKWGKEINAEPVL